MAFRRRRFRTLFGRFSDAFGRFRTLSEACRTLSDGFRRFSDVSGRLSDVFGRLSHDFGRLFAIVDGFSPTAHTRFFFHFFWGREAPKKKMLETNELRGVCRSVLLEYVEAFERRTSSRPSPSPLRVDVETSSTRRHVITFKPRVFEPCPANQRPRRRRRRRGR